MMLLQVRFVARVRTEWQATTFRTTAAEHFLQEELRVWEQEIRFITYINMELNLLAWSSSIVQGSTALVHRITSYSVVLLVTYPLLSLHAVNLLQCSLDGSTNDQTP